MNAAWWEGLVRFICGYWWIFLVLLILGLTAYFTRDLWLPALTAALGL